MQYLIAYTSNSDILHNGEWTTNGAGLPVSHKFGFGAIDAEAMVTRARRWTNVPEQLSYQKNFTNSQRYARSGWDSLKLYDIIRGKNHTAQYKTFDLSVFIRSKRRVYCAM